MTDRSGQFSWREAGILVLVTVAVLLPFCNRAFNIDDPLFVWAARQIHQEPFDFYGFPVHWYWEEQPMHEVMQNPPLTSYVIAVAALVAGWSELGLHLVFLIPAVGAVLGTYVLASRLCSRPLLAAMAVLVTPGFLVSSTTVMSDITMLCFWMWAVVLWEVGLRRKDFIALACSAFLIGLSALTKYYGASLIPLLAAYAFASTRRFDWWLLPLFIPIVMLGGYEWWTVHLYGHGLLSEAILYPATVRPTTTATGWISSALVALGFAGGCASSVLFFAHRVWSVRLLSAAAITGFLLVFILPKLIGWNALTAVATGGSYWSLLLQSALWVVLGLSMFVMSGADLWRRRDENSLLLALWIFGTFFFAGFVNWTVSGRTVLPVIPAVTIVLMRRLDDRVGQAKSAIDWRLTWPLIPAGALALVVTWGDYRLANSTREAAGEIVSRFSRPPRTIRFQGHWGFQYYLEDLGGQPMNMKQSTLSPGDLIVVPNNNTNVTGIPEEYLRSGAIRYSERIEVPAAGWVTTMSQFMQAGFYSSVWGPLPFALGVVPDEQYHVFVVSPAVRSSRLE